jgi:hypothetical protein
VPADDRGPGRGRRGGAGRGRQHDRGRGAVGEQRELDDVLPPCRRLEVQGAQLHAGDQGAVAGGGGERRGGAQRRQGRVAAHVPDGEAADVPVEAEVADQVHVQPRAVVAGAGDGEQVAHAADGRGGVAAAGAGERDPGGVGAEPACRRDERAHALGGGRDPVTVVEGRQVVEDGGAPGDAAGGEHVGPCRVPAGQPAEHGLDDLGLVVDARGQRGPDPGEPDRRRARGHPAAFL